MVKNTNKQKQAHPETIAKYAEAIHLYRTTQMSCRAICERCGVSTKGFATYLNRYHRELLLKRYGVEADQKTAENIKLRKKFGQTPAAHQKYKQAVNACDHIDYLSYNVSQIAHEFHLDGSALANQLKAHYPHIPERREKERTRRCLNDNKQRGVRPESKARYAEAVEMLHAADRSIRQVAEKCNVSYSGLKQHLLFYHKDLIEKRRKKRMECRGNTLPGTLNGNGKTRRPDPHTVETYREASRLYRTTTLTVSEIAEQTHVTESGFRSYLRTWHREWMMERRGVVVPPEGTSVDLSASKRYRKSAAAKYEPAIRKLKENKQTMAEVAREFGLHPESFRNYLHEHEPQLAESLGKTSAANGKILSKNCMEKYAEAMRIYETTPENLKSIAQRLGLPYNSVGGFIRRNFPDVIERHNQLVAERI